MHRCCVSHVDCPLPAGDGPPAWGIEENCPWPEEATQLQVKDHSGRDPPPGTGPCCQHTSKLLASIRENSEGPFQDPLRITWALSWDYVIVQLFSPSDAVSPTHLQVLFQQHPQENPWEQISVEEGGFNLLYSIIHDYYLQIRGFPYPWESRISTPVHDRLGHVTHFSTDTWAEVINVTSEQKN